mmetsp:Transcript_13772/g.40269  ORF Transcript_13772/g.40269 Transcript_13772/m.40269 type:complete len:221 (-) Transcript_13772:388-1050(-)
MCRHGIVKGATEELVPHWLQPSILQYAQLERDARLVQCVEPIPEQKKVSVGRRHSLEVRHLLPYHGRVEKDLNETQDARVLAQSGEEVLIHLLLDAVPRAGNELVRVIRPAVPHPEVVHHSMTIKPMIFTRETILYGIRSISCEETIEFGGQGALHHLHRRVDEFRRDGRVVAIQVQVVLQLLLGILKLREYPVELVEEAALGLAAGRREALSLPREYAS